MKFYVGDYVYWSDPDDGLCDTPGHVIEIRGDDVYVIKTDTGGIVEAFEWELTPVDPSLLRRR